LTQDSAARKDRTTGAGAELQHRHFAFMARRKALWAERKADEAAESDKPWALRNLRLYQNHASRFWGEHFAAVRAEESDSRQA